MIVPGGMPNTIITTIVPVGPASTHTNCPHCHAEINTTVVSTPSIWAYVSGAAIALIGSLFQSIPSLLLPNFDKNLGNV